MRALLVSFVAFRAIFANENNVYIDYKSVCDGDNWVHGTNKTLPCTQQCVNDKKRPKSQETLAALPMCLVCFLTFCFIEYVYS